MGGHEMVTPECTPCQKGQIPCARDSSIQSDKLAYSPCIIVCVSAAAWLYTTNIHDVQSGKSRATVKVFLTHVSQD